MSKLARAITITIITTGVILATLRTITMNVSPNTYINFKTYDDVVFYINESATGNITIGDVQLPLLHYDATTGKFYKSSTANMENLSEIETTADVYSYPMNIRTNYATGGVLYIDSFTCSGTDALNNALRFMIKYGNTTIVAPTGTTTSEEGFKTTFALGKSSAPLTLYVWYELDDENMTYQNINDANGTTITFKLGLYINESN